uniref:Uncharacterized protein n=1 Tax=Moniliophthora roreri TaxID=221103 RepID=A0A0W0F549_MONRR
MFLNIGDGLVNINPVGNQSL